MTSPSGTPMRIASPKPAAKGCRLWASAAASWPDRANSQKATAMALG